MHLYILFKSSFFIFIFWFIAVVNQSNIKGRFNAVSSEILKMTGENPEVRSDKRKPRVEREEREVRKERKEGEEREEREEREVRK